MKLSKKKVFALALAVCLIATLSMGTLAWFTDQDSVKNDFYIAGSEDGDKDKIFSVDVWEDKDGDGDPDDDIVGDEEGLKYDRIQPGDVLTKIAHVKNTGLYDQYIRVKITVSHANIWQEAYGANLIPVTEFVNGLDMDAIYGITTQLDAAANEFVYYLYFKAVLPHTTNNDMTVFESVNICEHLTREQAATLKNEFNIKVTADAIQTANVGTNVYEAFETVGMATPLNTVEVADTSALNEALEAEKEFIVLTDDIDMHSNKVAGKSAELYLNHFTLETPAGVFAGEYGIAMEGDLTISGHGNLEVYALKVQVKGAFVNKGAAILNPERIVDVNGDPVVLP